ncbi:hypothetical protein GCM10010129_84310 [Streptomyces fumigatiscleroticus]|nr:hypothetical protein GCM10010129_84310 [Streptomyces fumigatiscleroticus]
MRRGKAEALGSHSEMGNEIYAEGYISMVMKVYLSVMCKGATEGM